jgi:hypothetical protein
VSGTLLQQCWRALPSAARDLSVTTLRQVTEALAGSDTTRAAAILAKYSPNRPTTPCPPSQPDPALPWASSTTGYPAPIRTRTRARPRTTQSPLFGMTVKPERLAQPRVGGPQMTTSLRLIATRHSRSTPPRHCTPIAPTCCDHMNRRSAEPSRRTTWEPTCADCRRGAVPEQQNARLSGCDRP